MKPAQLILGAVSFFFAGLHFPGALNGHGRTLFLLWILSGAFNLTLAGLRK